MKYSGNNLHDQDDVGELEHHDADLVLVDARHVPKLKPRIVGKAAVSRSGMISLDWG
jgi:hypothetical protein